MSGVTFKEIFRRLEGREGVDSRLLRGAFDAILAGDWTPSQVAGLLVTMRLTGEASRAGFPGGTSRREG